MKCPTCHTPLKRIKYSGVKALECPGCRGHLVEEHRVETIERRVEKDWAGIVREIADSPASDTLPSIRCPRCRNRMDKQTVRTQRDFHIDSCSHCNFVWLDGGELAEIQLSFGSKAQTVELDRMRARLANMSPSERTEYENDLANLIERGTEMEILIAVSQELTYQSYASHLRRVVRP